MAENKTMALSWISKLEVLDISGYIWKRMKVLNSEHILNY